METILFQPLIVPAKTAVLLVFVPDSLTQQIVVNRLLERVGAELGDVVRITRVDQVVHPEVVRSFGVQQLPSFILLRQGAEIWRHNGLPDLADLMRLLTERLQEATNW
ncbi:thioredoxin family protein [Larkinella insperata]|uniref:Thioredoxin family protein n=1 Tax=Larkinella insperata TaxID=332158 RepID=A0ABW3QAF9_9BACT|nr:thioredoxin family protein [Larkinella insperata]